MKHLFQLYLTLLTLITLTSCKFSKRRLEYLKSKYLTKISPRNLETLRTDSRRLNTILYDSNVIKEIIDELGFPESYNFFEKTGARKYIKNQKYCGSCWSHATTSVLGYRFYQQMGIDVNLSPQNGLSCSTKDCENGNYEMDSAMYLVKNGAVTEDCFPFVSGDGVTMPECPTTCQDGSEYKKYYAQNVFTTAKYYSTEYFYTIVALILDQLVNYGPVMSGIQVFDDFNYWIYDRDTCKTGVYTYDGRSVYTGGHALVIVGYGKLDDKYYWLLQNSWGEESCDEGFVKIEMGQVGVEQVTFFEPYLPNQSAVKKSVNLNFDVFNYCYMKIAASNKEDWKNTVEFIFKNSNSESVSVQCGRVLSKYIESDCSIEVGKLSEDKYKLVSHQSLGTENNFNLDGSFDNIGFQYLGDGICSDYNSDDSDPNIVTDSQPQFAKLSMFIILSLILLI